jgi:4-hydroxy-tetrahydrodipicolinate synthase
MPSQQPQTQPQTAIRQVERVTLMKPTIVGSIVALVTPMLEDGKVDYAALRRLIDWHIREGTDCIGVVGTTGESPTVSMEENREIIRVAVEHAQGRVPVMAGTGANSTAEAIELSRYAQSVGASCTLSVVPYYNKPSQEGIYQHFKAISEAVDIEMVLYNVPSRTVTDMQVDTVLRLAQLPGIVGIKEASGDIGRAAWLIKQAPPGFAIYSGDDSTAVALMLLGGHGNVSVTANVAPKAMHHMCVAAMKGQAQEAAALHLKLLPLHKNLFIEPSPAPTKWVMAQMGLCGAAVRLPITPTTAAAQAVLAQAMLESGLR